MGRRQLNHSHTINGLVPGRFVVTIIVIIIINISSMLNNIFNAHIVYSVRYNN